MPGACGFRPCARTHLKNALCHTFLLGWASTKYHKSHLPLKFSVFLVENLSSNFRLMGQIRPAVMSWAVRVEYVLSLEIPLASGGRPQALTLFGGVGFIARRLRGPFLGECRRGLRHFWKCRARVGYASAPEPTLKNALCHTRPLGGTEDKSIKNHFPGAVFYSRAFDS